jgi:putative IMPACT (imprinted ancient) family translation regulator
MYSYKTVAAAVRTKTAVGACRFYASLSFCRTEEARSFLQKVREELTSATHHAYAFRLGVGDKLLARCDDDGEPAGTAGPPMLAVLEKADLTNVIVVGTRYFGGVKLGVRS